MNSENLHIKEEYTASLVLASLNGTSVQTSGTLPFITWTWNVDWTEVFKHTPRTSPAQSTYLVTHEFYGDHLSGPTLAVSYTVTDLLSSPQTTNMLITSNLSESSGFGTAPYKPISGISVINNAQWETPIGAVSIDGQVGYYAVRKATPSQFICRNPERSSNVSLRFIPNNSAYDTTYFLSDTQGVHHFHFKLLL